MCSRWLPASVYIIETFCPVGFHDSPRVQLVVCLVSWLECVYAYAYAFNHKKFHIFMWSNLVIFPKLYGSETLHNV